MLSMCVCVSVAGDYACRFFLFCATGTAAAPSSSGFSTYFSEFFWLFQLHTLRPRESPSSPLDGPNDFAFFI